MKYWLYRFAFRAREWFPWWAPAPVHIDVELAGRCQLACTMCPYGDHGDGSGSFDTSRQGMMPRELAASVLGEARELGARSVKLNFRGEPGLSPLLLDMIKLAKSLGYVEVAINTNLTAFSLRRLVDLASSGLDLLIVSADGATAETYEQIRVKGNFQKLVGNLAFLRTLPARRRPRTRIQMTVQDANRHEVPLARARFEPVSDELKFNPVRSDHSGKRKRCPQPWQRLVIMWDGQVGACCSNWNNEAIIGRYPEQSLREIWNGARRRQLLHYAADPNRGGPCKGCLVGGSYA